MWAMWVIDTHGSNKDDYELLLAYNSLEMWFSEIGVNKKRITTIYFATDMK